MGSDNNSSDAFSEHKVLTAARGHPVGLRVDPAEARLCFLRNGTVRTYRIISDGREITTGLMRTADTWQFVGICTELNLIEALTRCEYISISSRSAARSVANHPRFLEDIFLQVIDGFDHCYRLLEDLAFRDVSTRIANLLMLLAEEFGVQEGDEIKIALRLSQERLASMVSSSRPTVNIGLSQLRSLGVVAYRNGFLVVINPEKLRLIAGSPTGEG